LVDGDVYQPPWLCGQVSVLDRHIAVRCGDLTAPGKSKAFYFTPDTQHLPLAPFPLVNYIFAMNPEILPLTDEYRSWARELLIKEWADTLCVSRGRTFQADQLPGFVALFNGNPAGLVTYNIEGDRCEITTLNSVVEKRGIGRALVESVRDVALSSGCKRLWLITTNDNTYAFKFYQKLGFVVAAYHKDAMKKSRKLKPSIPLTGMDGIPIKDEIEFEMTI